MNLTDRIARFIIDMKSKHIDEELIEQFKKAYLDFLCAAITGSQTEVGKNVYRYFQQFGGDTSSIIGSSGKLNHQLAAFVNGTSAHCLDFDDGHTKGSVHPGCVVFPAVLALAEKNRNEVEDIIKAVIIGYEVIIRISSAMHPFSRLNGYHNTSVAGVFGAAAASSFLLNLSYEQIIGALGNASSFAGGTFAFLGSGTEIKRIHPGIAARDGIIAAELTTLNIIGPDNIFEKSGGVFDIFARGNFNQDITNAPLGESFEFINIYFKPYPCCRHLHVIIDALKELKDKYMFKPEEIAKIEIGVTKVASFHNNADCQVLLDAQMSIPFVTAATIIENNITVSSFENNKWKQEEYESLMKKVFVFADDECEKLYPQKRATRIRIGLKNGRSFELFYDGVRGEPPNPMTMANIENKFMDNCQHLIGKERVLSILQQVNDLKILECLNECRVLK